MFKNMLLANCVKKKAKKLPISHSFEPNNGTDADFKNNLREHFKSSDQPIGIRYCSQVLTEPDLDAINFNNTKPRMESKQGKCGSHASMLVASRPASNSCEYLLRNTWGAGYGSWTKNWKCDCKNKKTGAYFGNCKKDTHPSNKYEVIGCWVPESKLIKNLYGTQWLE